MKKKEDYSPTALKNSVYETIAIMSDIIGVRIPRKKYPYIKINNDFDVSSYNARENIISIRPSDIKRFGLSVIAEEASHFMRTQLRPRFSFKNNTGFLEHYTDEFFGSLGARLFCHYFLLENEENPHPYEAKLKAMTNKKWLTYIHDNRKKRKALKKTKEQLTNPKNPRNRVFDVAEERLLDDEREDILAHARPYQFASEVDLTQIRNLKQLYSLPDREVRSRFFRADKQYDLTTKPKPAQVTPRGLESRVTVIAMFFFVLSMVTSSMNITGNVIGTQNVPTKGVSFLLCILGLSVFLIFSKKEKQTL